MLIWAEVCWNIPIKQIFSAPGVLRHLTKSTPMKRSLQIKQAAPDTPIRVYTFQTVDAVNQLKRDGALRCSEDTLWRYSDYAGRNSAESKRQTLAYEWMRDSVIGQTGSSLSTYPIWAWLKRPRLSGKERKLHQTHVLITAIMPRGRMLISDYVLWHNCLNGFPVTISEAEDRSYEELQQSLNASQWEVAKKSTWARIFDFSPEAEEEPFWRLKGHVVLQACVDEIRFPEVVSIRQL